MGINNMDLFGDTSNCEANGASLISALGTNKRYFDLYGMDFSEIIYSVNAAVINKDIKLLHPILDGYKDIDDFIYLSSRTDNGVVCRHICSDISHILFADGMALHNVSGDRIQFSVDLTGENVCDAVETRTISNMRKEYSNECYMRYFATEIKCLMSRSQYGRKLNMEDLCPLIGITAFKGARSGTVKTLGPDFIINRYMLCGKDKSGYIKDYTLAVEDINGEVSTVRLSPEGLKYRGKTIKMGSLEFCMNQVDMSGCLSTIMENTFGIKRPYLIDSCLKVFEDMFIAVKFIQSGLDTQTANNYIGKLTEQTTTGFLVNSI